MHDYNTQTKSKQNLGMVFFSLSLTHAGLQPSVLHSLLILNMPSFVIQLSSPDSGVLELLWPSNITETFTVFGIPEEEFERLENVVSNSALSRAILGHIVQGTIYSATLTHRTIVTPIDGNFSIHVATVVTASTKVS